MSDKLFMTLVMAAVALAVGTGLWVVGGPMQGQRDIRDARRYQDLARITRALTCLDQNRSAPVSLPDTLTLQDLKEHCQSYTLSADNLTDPETGVPYVYDRIADGQFIVCATFYDAARTESRSGANWGGGVLDAGTGCIGGTLDPK